MSLKWRKKKVFCFFGVKIYLSADCLYDKHSLICHIVNYGKLYIYFINVCRIFFFQFEFNVIFRNGQLHFRQVYLSLVLSPVCSH